MTERLGEESLENVAGSTVSIKARKSILEECSHYIIFANCT